MGVAADMKVGLTPGRSAVIYPTFP